jgi:hypothetical protein
MMTNRILTSAALALIAVGLAGCVSPQGKLEPQFGSAVRQAIAAQTADPDAQYRRDAPPASSGARTQGAQERYNEGKVIPPSPPRASDVGDSGGSGASGGS